MPARLIMSPVDPLSWKPSPPEDPVPPTVKLVLGARVAEAMALSA